MNTQGIFAANLLPQLFKKHSMIDNYTRISLKPRVAVIICFDKTNRDTFPTSCPCCKGIVLDRYADITNDYSTISWVSNHILTCRKRYLNTYCYDIGVDRIDLRRFRKRMKLLSLWSDTKVLFRGWYFRLEWGKETKLSFDLPQAGSCVLAKISYDRSIESTQTFSPFKVSRVFITLLVWWNYSILALGCARKSGAALKTLTLATNFTSLCLPANANKK